MDYCDFLMSEYGWKRRYCLWELPFSAGIKFVAAIRDRLTGSSTLEERYRDKMLEALAAYQRDFNEQHNLGGK